MSISGLQLQADINKFTMISKGTLFCRQLKMSQTLIISTISKDSLLSSDVGFKLIGITVNAVCQPGNTCYGIILLPDCITGTNEYVLLIDILWITKHLCPGDHDDVPSTVTYARHLYGN